MLLSKLKMFFNTFTWALLFVFLTMGQRSYGLLFDGHMQFIDSYYTSVPLVEEHLQKKTFICVFIFTVNIKKKISTARDETKIKTGSHCEF